MRSPSAQSLWSRKFTALLLIQLLVWPLSASFSTAHAEEQDAAKEGLLWFSLGVGGGRFLYGSVGDTKNNEGTYAALSGIVNGSWYNQKSILFHTMRYSYVTDLAIVDNMAESVSDIGYLPGIVNKYRYGYMSLAAGVAYIYGQYKGDEIEGSSLLIGTDYEKKRYHSIGLPFQSELFFTPFEWFGVGFTGYADWNYYRPFWGVSLCVQFIFS